VARPESPRRLLAAAHPILGPRRGRVAATLLGVAACASVSAAATAHVPGRAATGDLAALAVAREHLAYETVLIDGVVPRLGPVDAAAARRVRDLTAGLDAELAARLARAGVGPGQARALWQARIGDGTPRPGQPVTFSCTLHRRESDAADLVGTARDALSNELASIELGLLVEGRQLAGQLGSAPDLARAIDRDQRDALHQLAPLLLPTDRDFAATA